MNINKKQIFAILIVVLMFMGAFVVLSSLVPPDNSVHNSPALTSVGETSSNSVVVNYYTQSSVANSGTTTVDLNYAENSSQTDVEFAFSSQLSISSGTATGSINLPANYYFTASTIGSMGIILPLPTYTSSSGQDGVACSYTVGTVSVELCSIGYSNTWSHTFNSAGGSNPTGYIEVYPSWTLSAYSHSTFTLSITITSDSAGSMQSFESSNSGVVSYSTPNPYSSSVSSNSVVITSSSPPTESSQPFVYGWHFVTTDTSFSIPQYTSSYDITWSSSSSTNPQYNSQSPTGTSGTLTGSLTSNSIAVVPETDPPAINPIGDSQYSFSYYLSSQYQISSASTTQTSSSSYTYTQVSGTANEASSSFSFSGSTPTGAVFIAYESSTNSLTTNITTVAFTPSSTVSNPYSTYAQNELTASISGASSGSGTSSDTASPSFTASSASYTSSTSPSWTVSLNLYGNVAPAYVSGAMAYSGTSSTANLYFNVSQPDFNGEAIALDINWGDGTTSSTSSTNYSFLVSHTYASVGTYSVSVQFYNQPSPDTNGLSNLSGPQQTFSYSISIGVTFNPPSLSVLQKGGDVNVSFSAHNDKVSTVVAYENGVDFSSASFGTSSGKMVLQPADAGVTGFTLTLDFHGAFATYSAQYAAPLYPLENSSYIVQTGSNNATHIYPVTLSNVPSGTGFYQQLLTISNPSQYGINSQGSNIQFVAGNGTLLYAWIQSINSTSMQVWVKNYNGSSVIDMQVFPSSENLFSANGYLGDTDYSNQKYVFESVNLSTVPSGYTVITNNSGISAVYGSDGLTIYDNTTAGGNAYYMLYSSSLFPQDSIVIVNETGSNAVANIRSIQPGFVSSQSTTLIDHSNNYSVAFSNGRYNVRTYSAFQGNESNPNYMSNPYASSFSDYTIFASYTGDNEIYYGNGSVSSSVDSPSGSVYLGIGIANYKPTTADYSFTIHSLLTSTPIASMPTYTIGSGSVFLANSSLLNYPSAGNTEPYNSTYERVLYTIPDAFNYNYMTMYYNDTWTFLYADPSYETVYPEDHAITFSGISGVSSVQVTMLQPIIKKVEPGAVSVSQIKGFSILSPGAPVSYSFALSSQGSPLPSSVISGLSSSSSFEFFSASTGLLEGEGFISPDGSNLNVNFTAPSAGLYYFKFSGSYEYNAVDYSFSYSGTFNSSTSKIYSEGLDVKVIAPSSLTVNSNATLLFQLYFPNGTSPDSAETSSILANSSLSLKSGNITLSKYNSFTLAANFSESIPDNYTLEFQVSKTMISGNAISYIQLISIPVVPKAVHVNNNMKMDISGPSNLIAGVPSSYIITFLTGNGTPFNSSETASALKGLNITVKLYSKNIAYGNASLISNGSAAFNLTLPVGTYYLLLNDSLVLPSGNASSQQSLIITVVNQTSRGLSLSISIAGTVEKGHATQGIISLAYTDGTYMSYLDTISIAKSIIINVYTASGTYLYSPDASAQSPGKIAFDVNISSPGSYTVYANYNGTVSGVHAAGSSSQSLSVVNYNPSQNTLSTITSWLDSFWVDIVSGIVTAFIIWFGAKVLLGRKSAKKSFNSTAAATTVGIANYENMKKSGQKIPINPKDYKDINKDIKKVGK